MQFIKIFVVFSWYFFFFIILQFSAANKDVRGAIKKFSA